MLRGFSFLSVLKYANRQILIIIGIVFIFPAFIYPLNEFISRINLKTPIKSFVLYIIYSLQRRIHIV